MQGPRMGWPLRAWQGGSICFLHRNSGFWNRNTGHQETQNRQEHTCFGRLFWARCADASKKRRARMMLFHLKTAKRKWKKCLDMQWKWEENGWALEDCVPCPKRIIVRLRAVSRARDLSDNRLSSCEAHRGGQRQPFADPRICPGGQRQRLTVNKSTLLV